MRERFRPTLVTPFSLKLHRKIEFRYAICSIILKKTTLLLYERKWSIKEIKGFFLNRI